MSDSKERLGVVVLLSLLMQLAVVACGPEENESTTAVKSDLTAIAKVDSSATTGDLKVSGNLTIAVAGVSGPSGLPRHCTAGCSETIYMSGITETLFNSKANTDGTVTAEPMLALDFTLDPS